MGNISGNGNKLKIFFITEDEEFFKSIERYLDNIKNNIEIEIERIWVSNLTEEDGLLKELLRNIKKIETEDSCKHLIIIDDFIALGNLEGVKFLKMIKSLWFPYKTYKSKLENNTEKDYMIPVLFISDNEVWRLEKAIVMSNAISEFGEEQSLRFHLNILKGTFFLKIPFKISDFKRIIDIVMKCEFPIDRKRIQILASSIGYEVHAKH